MSRYGIFELTDGATPERADRFAETIAAIDYPWRRIIPRLRQDHDQAVVVLWDALRQNVTGLYYGGNRIEIHLSESTADHVVSQEPFVLAHEIGHLVDGTTLTHADRTDLLDLMHRDPPIRLGHFDHDHRDAGHSVERWNTSEPYVSRINEAYADLFVAAFAPRVWAGELTGGHPRYPRFVHWTEDLAEVRRLTLRREIVTFTDVGPDNTHRDSIERAAELGLVSGYPDGTFRPEAPLTRAQAATIAVRQYDRILEEATR